MEVRWSTAARVSLSTVTERMRCQARTDQVDELDGWGLPVFFFVLRGGTCRMPRVSFFVHCGTVRLPGTVRLLRASCR
jgi:hypothetical protein